MSDVLCAIRGGPGSYQTRLAGLRHAKDNNASVHFLSVVDPVAYEPLHEGEQHAIRAEMAWRDLAMAKSTAAHAGLEDVRYTVAVKVGGLAETIAGYAMEVGAKSILIGTPRSSADAVLAKYGVGQFANELRMTSMIGVVVVNADGQSRQNPS